ncbi:MAG: RNA polymerase-binding protein DksA, partial [Noviherbaspirillum sp.]
MHERESDRPGSALTGGIMNATVTRSSTRNTGAKRASGTAAKSAAPPNAKAIGNSAQPASSKNAPAEKTIAKSIRTTVKNTVQSAAKTTAASKTKAKVVAALKPARKTPASKQSSKETSGTSMSGNNASAGLTDTMGKPVVSKVSEVATKTTKPTPAVAADSTLLTEAQILKMSDKDYMNEAQLAFFKARLQQLERDLLKNAGETTEHLRETVLVPDPADRATIEEEHALELRTRDRERKLLKKVQQAIASIDAGEY